MLAVPTAPGAVAAMPTSSANASVRSSPVFSTGPTTNGSAAKPKQKVISNGYHPINTQIPLSALVSLPLDLTSVERRGQPTAVREPLKKKSRPHGIEEAPTYTPTEEEWRDPIEYLNKIFAEASQYGICKIIPPDSWNPEFAIDTEKFHFRTRKQELNSVEGSTRANLSYLDGLMKFHKNQGNNLQRFPYVDKKPLDLYRLKKAVESRGGFEKVCKLKKWAEIGRDLGYSGKIMSSLSTSLKNSYQRWLCPYEEYLRIAKPGVHQQLEAEYGGPLTPSPAPTPARRSDVNTPSSMRGNSPVRNASDILQTNVSSVKKEGDGDVSMSDATAAPVSTGFTAINPGGFTAVNSGFTSVNRSVPREGPSCTPESRQLEGTPASGRNTPETRPAGLAAAVAFKRQASAEDSSDSAKKDHSTENDDAESNSRRSKRLKKDNVPTVAGSHMSVFRPTIPRVPREENAVPEEKCTNCGRGEELELVFTCDSCEHAYHGQCLDPPLKRRPDGEWNCPRCLVGDGHFGFEEGGLYSLKQFQQKANDFKQGYFETKMPFDDTLRCHRPVTEEDVEKEFWRLVADLEETVEVEYGADIHCTTHGSGFPTLEKHPNNSHAADPWNLNVLPFHPESLFRHIKSDISGMTVPWVYVGMIFSTFCWHNEDHYAYSANYQHFGATKTWYGIPGEDAEKFEAAMREAVPELFETQPDLLFQLVTLLTPEQLKKAGVRVYALDQRAGQMVFTFPQAYHAGFNHGFNFNEAVNFAPCDWESFGLAGVERLQAFRRQPCFSHDELLWTASDGSATSGLSIQTAKWLAPALDRIHKRELSQRDEFKARHLEASSHRCPNFEGGNDPCPLVLESLDEDVQDEEEQCCGHCKAFAYLSRFKCLRSGKVMCILHAGSHPCCEAPENERFLGDGHVLIYRKSGEAITAVDQKVAEKARQPEFWEERYEKLLDEEAQPSLKTLRGLLHEGERIPFELPSLPVLKEFVERCNDWVEEATNFIVRKQQVRRKNEKTGGRRSTGVGQKDRESRSVSDLNRLLQEAEHIGFDCPEISQLQERAATIKDFQAKAKQALDNSGAVPSETIEELMEEGRGFNIEIPELSALSRVLDQIQWNQKARANRAVVMSLQEVEDLIEEGRGLQIPRYNDHLTFYRDQLQAGEAWEKKAKELIHAEFVHYPQLEALATQVTVKVLPVSRDTFSAVEQILHKQREAHRQILDLTNRCREPDVQNRPRYVEVIDLAKRLDDLNSKPNGTIDLENEKKRHEDWMRKGKKLFGKSNAPLHILKSHLEYVLERNSDCFDIEHDTPRQPAEPVSREASPDNGVPRWEGSRPKQVFCICRKMEAGMMIECELCHEWYHCKCLKIARGKVKEDDKYTCPICDYRMRIPRDASRPKLEDLIALVDEIPGLPFQPEEEQLLCQIIDNAQNFRNRIAQYCNPIISTEAEIETQRFYLRKIEGAEVLLTFETNFFRQELHKWCPVAPQAPPILEVSLSTRKPRPTKLQKMLAEYGVDNPDDLPEHAKGKANSLRRKAANAEAATGMPLQSHSGPNMTSPGTTYASTAFYGQASPTGLSGAVLVPPLGHHPGPSSPDDDSMDIDRTLHPSLLGAGGPQLVDNSTLSLEERLLQGREDNIDLNTEAGKNNALDILRRTEDGRKEAERMWGPDVWDSRHRSASDHTRSITPANIDPMMKEDDGNVDQMFKEMTNQDDDEDQRRKDLTLGGHVSAASLETERNGMDALLDQE